MDHTLPDKPDLLRLGADMLAISARRVTDRESSNLEHDIDIIGDSIDDSLGDVLGRSRSDRKPETP